MLICEIQLATQNRRGDKLNQLGNSLLQAKVTKTPTLKLTCINLQLQQLTLTSIDVPHVSVAPVD